MDETCDRLIRVGSRGSALALRQCGMVCGAIMAANPGVAVRIDVIKTAGDRQQEWAAAPAALGPAGGKGIFVKEIEDALLERRIDAAVHSMKDMPSEIPEGLRIACVPRREDPRDVLVAGGGLTFETLPAGAKVGTGSPRRIAQLRHHRPDLVFVPIRGNVETRLRKMREGSLDAVVLAAAGLNRLGLMEAGWQPLDGSLSLPAVGQGALAIEARDEEDWILGALAKLHHPPTAACVAAERAFLAALGGGCQIPVAALALLDGGEILLQGVVSDPEGARLLRVEAVALEERPEDAGAEAARKAIALGAWEILAAIRGPAGA